MKDDPLKIFQKIRKIQFETTQLANDIMAGAWHSAFKGQGMEFEEVREYQSGDDVRMIDWRVTARMDRPYLKIFKEERELTVFLIVDVSASSHFGSSLQKKDLIAEIGAVLAFSAIKNNDKVGLILFSNRVEKYVPPKRGTRHVLRVIRELVAFEPKHVETDMTKALSFINGIQNRTAICFLISDFMCEKPFRELSLTAQKHDLIAINVVDPYEIEFPKLNLVQFTDLESGTTSIINTSSAPIERSFNKKAIDRINTTETLMEKIGAGFVSVQTDKPYFEPIRKFFKLRQLRR